MTRSSAREVLHAVTGWWRTRRPPAAAGAAPGASAGGGALRLGRYLVERPLGQGAMGTVYLGHDVDDGTPVALKTLSLGRGADDDEDDGSVDELRRRFLREAQVARRLRHPDIVSLRDAGETRGLAWIAMDFAAGHDLSRHGAPASLLPLAQVLQIGIAVAGALAHAHGQGVVHRDIKPANLMLDPASGRVKVMDFGVAHLGDAARTRTGMVLGTPSYMAPEQLAGAGADPRADLYALGATLFQLLSGRLPFEAPGLGALMARIANEPVPDLRACRADLPPALADVIALALQKRPETRYANGTQMADDLRLVAAALGAGGVNSGGVPSTPAAGPALFDRHNSL